MLYIPAYLSATTSSLYVRQCRILYPHKSTVFFYQRDMYYKMWKFQNCFVTQCNIKHLPTTAKFQLDRKAKCIQYKFSVSPHLSATTIYGHDTHMFHLQTHAGLSLLLFHTAVCVCTMHLQSIASEHARGKANSLLNIPVNKSKMR